MAAAGSVDCIDDASDQISELSNYVHIGRNLGSIPILEVIYVNLWESHCPNAFQAPDANSGERVTNPAGQDGQPASAGADYASWGPGGQPTGGAGRTASTTWPPDSFR